MYPAYNWWTNDPRPKEAIPSPMKMDLSSSQPIYQPWPYVGNYSYPVPHPYHGCCNHTYYGGAPYGFCPPYTHYPPPPPPPFHPHGLYSPFPGGYPVPPQHYSVEQPRYEYEYDKNHHSCGCNHRDDDKGRKIKEEPQVDKETSDSLVPLLLKDSPDYPILWVPRGYTESKADKEKYSHDPVSVKHPQALKQGGDGERAQDEQGGDGNRFPFQIFWLPSKDDEVGKETKGNNLDLVPNKGLSDDKTAKNDEAPGECTTRSNHAAQKVVPVSTNEETRSSHPVQKVIPVKQVSTDEEKKNPKSRDFVINSDSVEKTDKASKTSPKASKLPPVCLRIDPLPRKKRSSRSPSPGEKERSNGSPVKNPKSSEQQSQVQKRSTEEQSEGNMQTTDHANKVERENLADHGDNVPRGKGDESERKIAEEKKNLSEHEAALIIQSVYRGFEVRKSQPLKKLRQINEVKKQVYELRIRIQDLESSSSSIHSDGKKEVIIGESIMSLLLKLDTIQGLHPFVREVRKSVAKELVGLQEKLDSLTSIKSETPNEQVMHPEDDAIQANSDQTQAHVGLCENHEHNAKESQYDDDVEACNAPNLEQQSKKSTEESAIQGKFDVATTEYGTVICENQEVEAAESQEDCNTIGEAQLYSDKEKFEQAPAECDGALRMGDDHEVGAIETQEGCKTAGKPQLESDKEKFSQAPTECAGAQGLCENHEVEATESQERCNDIREPQSELVIENFDQAPTECDEALRMGENHEVEAIESQEGCNTISELQLELPTEDETLALCEDHEVEITKSLEGCDTKDGPELESDKRKLDEAQTECGEAVELCESDEVEAAKLLGGCNVIGEPQLESPKEKLDQAPTESDGTDEALGLREDHEVEATNCVDKGDVGAHAVELEHNSQELNNNKHQMPTETAVHGDDSVQDLVPDVNVETMMHDSDVCQNQVTESYNDSGAETCKNNPESHVVSCENLESGHNGNDITDDVMEMKCELVKQDAAKEIEDDLVNEAEGGRGRLMVMEENEKLKAAVEELMKAGNEQLGVIRELTGRVKDLEKKLSKKKKKIRVNKGRRSRGCVVQKD